MSQRHKRVSTDTALLINLGTRWRWVVNIIFRPLYTREKSHGIHFIGGWLDPKVGLDGCGEKKISLPQRGSNLEPRTVQAVVSRYTDYAKSVLHFVISNVK